MNTVYKAEDIKKELQRLRKERSMWGRKKSTSVKTVKTRAPRTSTVENVNAALHRLDVKIENLERKLSVLF